MREEAAAAAAMFDLAQVEQIDSAALFQFNAPLLLGQLQAAVDQMVLVSNALAAAQQSNVMQDVASIVMQLSTAITVRDYIVPC